MDLDLLISELVAGKTAALARAISVVENARPGFERLLGEIHRSLGRARRIGITGPPGRGNPLSSNVWLPTTGPATSR
jgi:putative protein kinase ArgK-like GTPase of G3E family